MRFFILFMLCFLASEQDITADAAISKSILYEAMPGLTDVTRSRPVLQQRTVRIFPLLVVGKLQRAGSR